MCPWDSVGFEHDIVNKFANALHRRFKASATPTKQHVTPWAQLFPVKP